MVLTLKRASHEFAPLISRRLSMIVQNYYYPLRFASLASLLSEFDFAFFFYFYEAYTPRTYLSARNLERKNTSSSSIGDDSSGVGIEAASNNWRTGIEHESHTHTHTHARIHARTHATASVHTSFFLPIFIISVIRKFGRVKRSTDLGSGFRVRYALADCLDSRMAAEDRTRT